MNNYGIVKETRGEWAKVEIQRHQSCKNCGACGAFSGSSENKKAEIDALNLVGAEKGQFVKIESQLKDMLLAAFILYIFPLLVFFAGLWVGFNYQLFIFITSSPELNGLLLGFAGMTAAYFFIRRWSQGKLQGGRRFKAEIREIVQ